MVAEPSALFPVSEPFSPRVLGLRCSFKIINFKQAVAIVIFVITTFQTEEKKERKKPKECMPIKRRTKPSSEDSPK